MRRWMFELPGLTFARPWTLGSVTFRPPGAAESAVLERAEQVGAHTSWAAAHEVGAELAERWRRSSTVETEADDLETAQHVIGEAMAALRFLMREVVTVNVDVHRVGLVGEAQRAVREYLVMFSPERVAPGWTLVDDRVPFHYSADTLDAWDTDERVRWLADQMAAAPDQRSLSGRRVVTALEVLDRAFLATDPVIRVALCAVAVEVLLCDPLYDDDVEPARTGSLRIAARAAYLTCGNRCATDREACPYVLGFKGQKHLWATAERWAASGEEWRCSAFLNIARPPDMNHYFKRPSLFGARNQAVHEGRTTLDASDIKWMRIHADEAIRAFLTWVATRPSATVADLDAEIAEGAARFGEMTPKR